MIDDEPSAPTGYALGGIWSTTAFVGRGPVGEVYECRRSEAEGTFIAKLLPEELLESSEIWSSYLAAVSAAGSLPTDATVRHVAFGSDLQLGCPFIVTERVPWPALAASIKKSGPVTPKVWGKTLAALVALLERAHAAEIPHGRLTPSNVFVSPDDPGKVKVTDFGLGSACAARAGETLGGGVLGWAGPESEEPGAKPTVAGDVYSLGLLTFFALTGKRPFRALDAEQVHRKLLRGEMTAALKSAAEIAKKLGVELDPAFDKWFSRAIVPSPAARYSTVKLQGEAFEHVLRRIETEKPTAAATKPITASPAASPPRPSQKGTPIASTGASRIGLSRGTPSGATASTDESDEQPTLKLKIETLFAGAQRAQAKTAAREAATGKPVPAASRAVPPRAFTALAPPIASPAPPPVAAAAPSGTEAPPVVVAAPPVVVAAPPVVVPAPPAAMVSRPVAVASPPVVVASPPVVVPAPPVAMVSPPVAVAASPLATPAPELALAPPPADEPPASSSPSSSGPASIPIVGTPVRAVGESLRAAPAPAQPFVESTPVQFTAASLVAPQSAAAEAPALVATNPQPLEPGTATVAVPLVTRPKIAVALGAGLVLCGLVVGILIGARRGRSEPPPASEPARAPITATATQAPSPPAVKPADAPPTPEVTPSAALLPSVAIAAPPEASASAAVSAQPTAAPPHASASPASPASTSAPASPSASAAAAKPQREVAVPPVPTANTSVRRPDATKTDATKASGASARKKPCGTFINPCQ